MTAAESVARPGSPPSFTIVDESPFTSELPQDVFFWKIYLASKRLSRRGLTEDPNLPPAQVVAHTFVLEAVAGRADAATVLEKVQIYVVRADGSLVFHDALLGDGRTHRPRSVFMVLGQGDYARFTFFANTALFGARWPAGWGDIPRYPGMALILTFAKDQKVPTRHAFACPEDLLGIWAGPVCPLRAPPPQRPRPRPRRR